MILRCPKCNSENLLIIPKGSQTGLYCSECGAWIKWLGKNEKTVYEAKNVEEINPVKTVSKYIMYNIKLIVDNDSLSDKEKIEKIRKILYNSIYTD